MSTLASCTSYAEALAEFSWPGLWELFDGEETRLNIAHECLDRHRPQDVAIRVVHADGLLEELTFGELAAQSSQFAHYLEDLGVAPGARVGVMLDPGRAFYSALFGTIKRGAVAVPLYTLFGPDAIRARLEDCGGALLVTSGRAARMAPGETGAPVVLDYERDVAPALAAMSPHYRWETSAADLAILQYTSGTTRQLPEAVRHHHRSVVTLARAGLFGLGLKPGDRFFCPSSPAWGHGLWHGTLAPLSLGVSTGSYSGRFELETLAGALRELAVTNLAAAGTIYRMLVRSGHAGDLPSLEKASYTGEELGREATDRFLELSGVPLCGMYGTTETGVILGNYPGFEDFEVRPGALGKPLPGWEVAILDDAGRPVANNQLGEIAIRRRGEWFGAKDLGYVDDDGYFWYQGRADDVFISAGWTISPVEVERTMLAHPAVREVAVLGSRDALRGQVVKALVVTDDPSDGLAAALQDFVRERLSKHEYPRIVELVDELPKTPNGKIDRRALREAEGRGAGRG